ncbi:MAG: hypothetical protein EOM20_10175 [Spartobacteria bacterium]|nr:hypothetical protein [Spartobacteria bacterium]
MRWFVCGALVGVLSLCGCSHTRPAGSGAGREINPEYETLIRESVSSSVSMPSVPGGMRAPAPNAWLRKTQGPEGGWEAYRPVRTVALAGLALWGGRQNDDNRQAAWRAAQWLARRQEPDGHWAVKRARERPVDQALAVWFLATALPYWEDPTLAAVVERGARYILDHQQPGGGWAYSYGKGAYRNTLISVCQLLALRATVNAGLLQPEIEESFTRSLSDLLSVQDRQSGAFGDEFRGVDRWSATGEGVLGLQVIGLGRIPETMHGVEALEGMVNGWLGAADWPLLECLLNHYAFQLQGGTQWERWSDGVTEELLEWQQPDGSWQPPGSELILGPAYATALCSLVLQGVGPVLQVPDATRSWRPPLWALHAGDAVNYVMLTVPLASFDTHMLPPSVVALCASAERIVPFVNEDELYEVLPDYVSCAQDDSRCVGDPALLRRVAALLHLPKLGVMQLSDIQPWALVSAVLFVAIEDSGLEYDILQRNLSFMSRATRGDTLLEAGEFMELLDGINHVQQLAALSNVVNVLQSEPGLMRKVADAWGRGDTGFVEQQLSLALPAGALSDVTSVVAEKLHLECQDRASAIFLLEPVFVLGTNNVLDRLRHRGYRIERE